LLETSQTVVNSTRAVLIGRILSGLVIVFLLFDSVIKFIKPAPVSIAFDHLGWPISAASVLGAILLASTVLYALPRTSILGAILLTGYFGGAVATHFRVGDPLFSHVLFPVYIGAMLWLGLYLRDNRLRSSIPLRY
jgi:hypothetical protein